MYAAHLVRESNGAPLYRRLRMHLVAELGGSDPVLAGELAVAPLPDPASRLRAFADQRRWPARLPAAGLWELGMKDLSEGRRFLHSAAVARVGRDDEVRRRIWRAQVSVLFPFIEECRADLVAKLDGQLRVPLETPFGVIDDKRDLEIGQIGYQLARANVPDELRRLVGRLTAMRHALAHLEMVGPEYLFAPEVKKRAAVQR